MPAGEASHVRRYATLKRQTPALQDSPPQMPAIASCRSVLTEDPREREQRAEEPGWSFRMPWAVEARHGSSAHAIQNHQTILEVPQHPGLHHKRWRLKPSQTKQSNLRPQQVSRARSSRKQKQKRTKLSKSKLAEERQWQQDRMAAGLQEHQSMQTSTTTTFSIVPSKAHLRLLYGGPFGKRCRHSRRCVSKTSRRLPLQTKGRRYIESPSPAAIASHRLSKRCAP